MAIGGGRAERTETEGRVRTVRRPRPPFSYACFQRSDCAASQYVASGSGSVVMSPSPSATGSGVDSTTRSRAGRGASSACRRAAVVTARCVIAATCTPPRSRVVVVLELRDAREEDSGLLAVPGEDRVPTPRDATWKGLEETGRLMAAAFVPGGSVVVALGTPDRARARIVRIQPDGEARIIAEVDPGAGEDDGEVCAVTFVRWDAARGCLLVGGSFGIEAYRPASA